MTEYVANVLWRREKDQSFVDNRYRRSHEWRFDGGTVVRGSASPQHVPAPFSDPRAVDPEEAFVAALSSCHMLCFLSIAAKRGMVIESYDDAPVGYVEERPDHRFAFTRVVLRPRVELSGESQSRMGELEEIHRAAHRQCFLANSVQCEVLVEAR